MSAPNIGIGVLAETADVQQAGGFFVISAVPHADFFTIYTTAKAA